MFDRENTAWIAEQGRKKGRIGAVFSAWDLLHAGHCLYLMQARQQCDFLVAGLHRDPSIERPTTKNAPVLSLVERGILIRSNVHVDAIIEYDTEQDHHDILTILEPIRFVGSDYLRTGLITGKDLPYPVVYLDRECHGYSTSALRRRVWKAEEARLAETAAPLHVWLSSPGAWTINRTDLETRRD